MATKLKHNRTTPNVKAACEECRHRKTKCDGVRPVCSQCSKRARPCEYDAEPDEYRTATLKRKCKMFERQALAAEQLLSALRDLPPLEAAELFRRLRTGENIPAIISTIPRTQAQQAEQLMGSPSFSESYSSTGGADTVMEQPPPQPPQAQYRPPRSVPVQPPQVTTPGRSRLAIDFLVNGSDETCSDTIQAWSREANGHTGTNSAALSRNSSYPPITPTSLDQHRRSSAPMSNFAMPVMDMMPSSTVTAHSAAAPEAAMEQLAVVAPCSSSDWDKYYTNVSTLFRSLGETSKGPRP